MLNYGIVYRYKENMGCKLYFMVLPIIAGSAIHHENYFPLFFCSNFNSHLSAFD